MEKKHGFIGIIKEGLSYLPQILSASIFPKITEGTEMVMKNIDNKIIQIEKRVLRKIYSSLIIGFGGVYLTFALFFLLIEYLNWSKAAAFFSIGIIIFIIGLILKIGELNK